MAKNADVSMKTVTRARSPRDNDHDPQRYPSCPSESGRSHPPRDARAPRARWTDFEGVEPGRGGRAQQWTSRFWRTVPSGIGPGHRSIEFVCGSPDTYSAHMHTCVMLHDSTRAGQLAVVHELGASVRGSLGARFRKFRGQAAVCRWAAQLLRAVSADRAGRSTTTATFAVRDSLPL